jgi:hypothetical protein
MHEFFMNIMRIMLIPVSSMLFGRDYRAIYYSTMSLLARMLLIEDNHSANDSVIRVSFLLNKIPWILV